MQWVFKMSIEIFRQIVKLHDPEINLKVIDKFGNGTVILKELHPDAKLKEVAITGLDIEQTFAFKLDSQKYVLSPFLNESTPNITKACDGVIFGFVKSQLIVYLCELKSGKPQLKEYINKFKSSEAFIVYLEKLAKEFFDFDKQLIIKRLMFDKKKGEFKTFTKGDKLYSTTVNYNGNKVIEIYYIHHLKAGEFINVRHLA